MKTIKQIADEVDLPKQKVYRYIKKHHINEAHQLNGILYYDETLVDIIKSSFSCETVSSEAHQNHISDTVMEVLKMELEIKNKQIKKLQEENDKLINSLENMTQSLKASQTLHAGTIQQQIEKNFLTDGTERTSRMARLKQFLKGE